MNPGVATLALTLMLTTSAFAATPPKPAKPISLDKSGSFLIDPATSEALWKENLPARVIKLYPPNKFRFVSEVGGGFTDAKTCVVSARVMLLPVVRLPLQGQKVIYAPIKSATAFDAQPNLSLEQCHELAKTKLKDGIQSLASALAAS
jgi:hypothetical protein